MVISMVVSTAEAIVFHTSFVTDCVWDGGTEKTVPESLISLPPGAMGMARLMDVSMEKEKLGAVTGAWEYSIF